MLPFAFYKSGSLDMPDIYANDWHLVACKR
jgi:hypothetical protein